MIHALLLVLALQGGPVHADLHPADADVYVELGDAATLWPAFEQTSFVAFLRDTRLKGLVAKLGLPTDASIKGLVQKALATSSPEANTPAWLDGLKTVSFSFVATGAKAADEAHFRFQAVADFAAPAQADALKAALIAGASKHEPLTGSLPGVEQLTGDTPDDKVWCVSVGPRVVVGGGSAKVEDYVARADKKAPGFGANDKWKQGLAAFDKASGTTVLWFVLSRSIADVIAASEGSEDAGAKFLNELPADMNPLGGARIARMRLVGNRYVTEMFAAEAAPESAKPIDPATLEPVPDSAMFLYASSFDGAAMAKKLRAMVSKQEQGAATLAALEQKIGFGPERVLAHLGPGLTVYSDALASIGPPQIRVWVDCDDAAAFQKDLETLVGALGETLPGIELKAKPYKIKNAKTSDKVEVPVCTLGLPPNMQVPMVPLSPSFAPVGKRIVFGITSMDVKSELKRVYGGEADAIVAGANPLTARGFAIPEGARSIIVMDWGKLLGGLVKLYKGVAAMAGDSMPLDPNMLPAPEAFTEHFKPTFHFSKPVAGGTYRRNEASFGPETWLGLIAISLNARQAFQPGAHAPQAVDAPQPVPAGGKGK